MEEAPRLTGVRVRQVGDDLVIEGRLRPIWVPEGA